MKRRQFVTAGLAFGLAGGMQGAEAKGEKLRVAVIGHTGRGDYGHGLDTMWLKVPGVEVVAVADPVEEGREKARKRLEGVRGFSDFRELLAEIKPDIVSVAPRWVDQHAEMVMAAVEAGARGIYIEKPFSRTLAEADAMIAACEKAGTKLAVAHRNRYHPVLPVVKKLIADGLIGEVLEIRGRGKEDQRGGSLDVWVLGSHVFNLMNFFAGRALKCDTEVLAERKAVVKSDLKEGAEGIGLMAGEEVHARYRMENGWTAYFDSIKDAGGGMDTGFGMQILGTKGVLAFGIDRQPLVHFRKGNPFNARSAAEPWQAVSTAGVGVEEPIHDVGRMVSSHYLAGMDMLAAIREDRPPLCNGREGRMTVEMIEMALKLPG